MVIVSPQDSLPTYAKSLIYEVVEKTGFPLAVVEEEGIGYDSQLILASKKQPFHKLAYVPLYREYRVHFLVNAACKVNRVWAMPADERLVPVSERGKRLPRDYEEELHNKLQGVPEPLLFEISAFIYEGVVRQLTSMAMDIRVEQQIAKTLPEHHEAQQAYLARQVKDLETYFLPEIADVTPDRIYAASTAMNVVLTEEAARISGIAPGPMFRQTQHRRLGERLRDLLLAVEQPGYRGDRIATDVWAEELGLQGWYEWERLR